MDSTQFAHKAKQIIDAVETAIIGKGDVVELALSVLFSNGHLLIEDIPGVGKTTLAKALAKALGMSYKRIQFTPDLLPSDITGSSIFNQKTGEFEVRYGPVFANIVLADEINRTTPKTQSALLECMEERQVTIDGVSHPLPSPFFVIATQNNIELSGTYPLPEAQLDRFAARISIGYPDREAELNILTGQRHVRPVDSVNAETDPTEILAMQATTRDVHIDASVQGYIIDLVTATRAMNSVLIGVSPRGSLALLYACQARAVLQGRDFVKPDDVKALAKVILPHRMIIRPEQRARGVSALSCVETALRSVQVPAGF